MKPVLEHALTLQSSRAVYFYLCLPRMHLSFASYKARKVIDSYVYDLPQIYIQDSRLGMRELEYCYLSRYKNYMVLIGTLHSRMVIKCLGIHLNTLQTNYLCTNHFYV